MSMQELETVLVVENLPKVGRDRLGKLLAFVTKIYNNLDPSRPSLVENGIDMPFNEEAGTTEGCVKVAMQRAARH